MQANSNYWLHKYCQFNTRLWLPAKLQVVTIRIPNKRLFHLRSGRCRKKYVRNSTYRFAISALGIGDGDVLPVLDPELVQPRHEGLHLVLGADIQGDVPHDKVVVQVDCWPTCRDQR